MPGSKAFAPGLEICIINICFTHKYYDTPVEPNPPLSLSDK